ncbi:hypothetical protein L7F22_014480 [Adiantum nelumboides]|nr:hypothetical protein [Adiantum nelumboides]
MGTDATVESGTDAIVEASTDSVVDGNVNDGEIESIVHAIIDAILDAIVAMGTNATVESGTDAIVDAMVVDAYIDAITDATIVDACTNDIVDAMEVDASTHAAIEVVCPSDAADDIVDAEEAKDLDAIVEDMRGLGEEDLTKRLGEAMGEVVVATTDMKEENTHNTIEACIEQNNEARKGLEVPNNRATQLGEAMGEHFMAIVDLKEAVTHDTTESCTIPTVGNTKDKSPEVPMGRAVAIDTNEAVGVVSRAMTDTGIVHSGAFQVITRYLQQECHRGSGPSALAAASTFQVPSPAAIMIAGPPQYQPPLIRASAAGRHTNIQSCGKVSELNAGIAHFYDSSSGMWEDLWGEHMHIAYYDAGLPLTAALSIDHKQAQLRMIEESLKWAGISDAEASKPQKIIDVGCGIGGSSRYFARKYGAEVVGITLSPYQVQRSTELTSAAGLSSKVSFQVADALNQPFPDEHFDFVWSLECGEHVPDKEKFMSELARITKPGGQILIVTCCHRELSPGEESLKPWEQELLDKLYKAYYFPAWCAPSKYVELAETMGLQDIRSADWTKHITLFWPAVIVSAFTLKGMISFLKSGWTPIKRALALMSMMKGFNSGLMKYALITARKLST